MPKSIVVVLVGSGLVLFFLFGWIVVDQWLIKEETKNVEQLGQTIEEEYATLQQLDNTSNHVQEDEGEDAYETIGKKTEFSHLNNSQPGKVAKLMVATLQIQQVDLFSQTFHPQKLNDMLLAQPSGERSQYLRQVMNELSKQRTILNFDVNLDEDWLGASQNTIDLTITYEDHTERTFKDIPMVSLMDGHEHHDTKYFVFDIAPDQLVDYE